VDIVSEPARNTKPEFVNELVEIFGYHRKAAIRALRARPVISAPFMLGRHPPDQLLPAYEQEHRRLSADVANPGTPWTLHCSEQEPATGTVLLIWR
jgi:hypothetical protein